MEWFRQQQAMLEQQQQQLAQAHHALLQQQQQQQALAVNPTGFASNNPFALNQPGLTASPPPRGPSPTNTSISASSSRPSLSTPSTSPAPTRTNATDTQHAQLAALFANREDGLDTFGNIGNLRYGHSQGGRLVANPTGNPFHAQAQQQAEQPFFSI